MGVQQFLDLASSSRSIKLQMACFRQYIECMPSWLNSVVCTCATTGVRRFRGRRLYSTGGRILNMQPSPLQLPYCSSPPPEKSPYTSSIPAPLQWNRIKYSINSRCLSSHVERSCMNVKLKPKKQNANLILTLTLILTLSLTLTPVGCRYGRS